MRRLALLALAPLALAAPAVAQSADPHAGHAMPPAKAAPADPHAGHSAQPAPADPHAGHAMPAPPADPHAGHRTAPSSVDPHAGHAMPAAPADPHAGHQASRPPADPHAGHAAPAASADPHAGHEAPSPVGSDPPPPAPTDHAADRVYPAADMAAARAQLRKEHGAITWAQFNLETAEYRPSSDGDGFAWEGQASFGGDVNRFVLQTEGEGEGELESAEIQALYSRAISPYFNLQAGVRRDFEPDPSRSYAVLGIEGLAPYWFEVGAALFVSDRGDLSARLEAEYDLRLTQRLILEPRVELNLSASDVPELGLGSGLTDAEFGLRLRYAVTPDVSPYVGVVHEETFGRTADFAAAHGDETRDTRLVVGLRAWF